MRLEWHLVLNSEGCRAICAFTLPAFNEGGCHIRFVIHSSLDTEMHE